MELTVTDASGTKKLAFDTVLVAAGRRPHAEGLGLERIGAALDNRGFVPADGVCAIEDVTATPGTTMKPGTSIWTFDRKSWEPWL